MTELKLRLQVEGSPESTVSVSSDRFTLGRSPECDLCLPFFGVSRRHASFVRSSDGMWMIEDLGSLNGTLLNQVPVTAPQYIHHSDLVQVGVVYIGVVLMESEQLRRSGVEVITDGTTILRNVKDLQQLWLQVDPGTSENNPQKAIARLKDLVEISKGLNSAESIEAIFSKVQEVVFRDLKRIERLALLIDMKGNGLLELLNAATRNAENQDLAADGSWISHSICQKVFAERVAIQTADAQMDARFEGEHSILTKGIRSAMAVPLWDDQKVVGVLYADARLSSHHGTLEAEEDLSFFSALGNLVAASVQRWLMARKLRSEEIIRQRLERYHTPAVVQQMMVAGALDGGRLPLAEYEISILFADIVGFTALSERLLPSQIAELLNGFFEEMLQEVFVARGTLDKFIGDCIMAFFGAPEVQPDHADRAVAAARAMLARLEHLNAQARWSEPIQLRIAINSGKAVVGDIGSSQRVDYTVLGPTINLASRMESICPPGECVISEETYSALRMKQGFEKMGSYRFKGIDRPIEIYQTKRQRKVD
ncbi:MAG: FHA domain-containing protein [Desertifilum sp. SIO1I2]|nr:FHA domain-containing protein [Desertifilum sp. SIO1I2]